MRHQYQYLPPAYDYEYRTQDQFGQGLFNPTIPLGGTPRSAEQQAHGMPLGKITLDTTPALNARLDRLIGITEQIAREAGTTSKMAIGVAVVLGIGALGVALYKAKPTRYGT